MTSAESDFQVRRVRFGGDFIPPIRTVRHQVFTLEQQVDPAIDFDGSDPEAVHVLAVRGPEPLGTGRMLADGHIGRIAVLKQARGRGVGRQIVLALVEEAGSMGLNRVWLGAQEHAVGFYESMGFRPYGRPYIEADIRHIHMEMDL